MSSKVTTPRAAGMGKDGGGLLILAFGLPSPHRLPPQPAFPATHELSGQSIHISKEESSRLP